MPDVGEAMLDVVLAADTIADLEHGISLPFLVSKMDTIGMSTVCSLINGVKTCHQSPRPDILAGLADKETHMRKLYLAACSLILLPADAASASELSDKVCPILMKVAKEGEGQASFMVQANLVMQVGGAYDFKPEPLKAVLADVDDDTLAACPDARAAVLKMVEMDTLRGAMR